MSTIISLIMNLVTFDCSTEVHFADEAWSILVQDLFLWTGGKHATLGFANVGGVEE